jgi:hydroxymethylpyrimidine/phosphomethylpyrimidine kinase
MKLLIISGFDPSCGAGIVRDVITCEKIGVQPLAVISCNTSQNNKKFDYLKPIECGIIGAQLAILLEENKDLEVIKIGMLGSKKNAETIFRWIEKNLPNAKIILDTPFVTSSGGVAAERHLIQYITEDILPKCYLVTPNLAESKHINLDYFQTNILVTGGDGDDKKQSIDTLWTVDKLLIPFVGKRYNKKVRGTGCTLATAIACYLSLGEKLIPAIKKGKKFVGKYIQQEF